MLSHDDSTYSNETVQDLLRYFYVKLMFLAV